MKEEYTTLFNAVTAAIEELDRLRHALITAQRRCEKIYMERGE